MGDKSKIEWTDATWNPVTGCNKVSAGCKNCYAERLFPRAYGKDRKFTDIVCHAERLDIPLRWTRPRRIFVNSMSDLFHERVPLEFIGRVYEVMRQAHWHTFQILTKRPERMREFVDWWRYEQWKKDHCHHESIAQNIWWGISAEDQDTFDERLPFIQDENIPAAVRFLSLEPLIGPIDVEPAFQEIDLGDEDCAKWSLAVDWVIVGGESGPGARPMHPDWVRSIWDQCQEAEVPFFFKQWGEWAPGECCGYLSIRSEDVAWRFADKWTYGRITPKESEEMHYDDAPDVYRVGKKAAGASLDGREWKEYPA